MSAAVSSSARPCASSALADRADLPRARRSRRACRRGRASASQSTSAACRSPPSWPRISTTTSPASGIRDRHAGVGRPADRRRNARHDLERDALLVQEQRFLAAAVEHERVAPLEPHDGLALARLLGEQEADRVLIERLRRRGADVDPLGVRPGQAQQRAGGRGGRRRPRRRPARQRWPRTLMSDGIAGAGADDVDARACSLGCSPHRFAGSSRGAGAAARSAADAAGRAPPARSTRPAGAGRRIDRGAVERASRPPACRARRRRGSRCAPSGS